MMTSRGADDVAAAGAVAIVLRGPDGPQPPGLTATIEVEIRNEGAGDLWVVGVLDGSEEGVRYPRYRPSVTRDGIVVAEPPPPEDPLVGPLRETDFRRLRPGEAFDPTGAPHMPLATFSTFAPAEPGTYRYALELSTESGRPDEWLGRFGQDPDREALLELVGRVPRLTVSSNALEIEFRA